ncbi:MAG TPA: carboxypeptidase regulatory-like domain-containing protein [Polyangiales bacterium]
MAPWLLAIGCGDSNSVQSGNIATDDHKVDDGGEMDANIPRESGAKPNPRTDASVEPSTTCVNLQCQVHACDNGSTTSVSGTVYDPAGKNPLYGIAVYVPNAQPEPFTFGATCDRCDALYTGSPITAALTDAKGRFKLDNVPVGSNIPLVIQVGKWRRQLKIANVSACQDNPQADHSLRLPRNHNEGDIPQIAVSTGGADTLECLLRRVGVDASEYVAGDSSAGRIHIYHGKTYGNNPAAPNTQPAAPESEDALWKNADQLSKYDILLLSCEGDETQKMNQQALHDYTSAGGRVFASHYHYTWFNTPPFSNENLATWKPGGNDIGNIDADIVTKLPDGMPFAKGEALRAWLSNIGALADGKLHIEQARHNADVSAANTPSQAWIVAGQDSSLKAEDRGATQFFSFNTPTDAPQQSADLNAMYCGRVVYSDLHVGAASGDNKGSPVPSGCANRALSPQEAALEFMLFDLSSCITPDKIPPAPPPVIPIF